MHLLVHPPEVSTCTSYSTKLEGQMVPHDLPALCNVTVCNHKKENHPQTTTVSPKQISGRILPTEPVCCHLAWSKTSHDQLSFDPSFSEQADPHWKNVVLPISIKFLSSMPSIRFELIWDPRMELWGFMRNLIVGRTCWDRQIWANHHTSRIYTICRHYELYITVVFDSTQ